MTKEPWCFLGLPFNPVSMEEVCCFISDAAENKQAKTLTTTNINWVALSRKDPLFREQIALSDLNVMDGTPLFWGARFLGLPFPARIAGPTIVEHLMGQKKEPRLRVYFFGGSKDTAQKAFEHLKNSASGLTGAGYCNPGFGEMKEMCSEDKIRLIQDAKPDIVLLAVGAQKGMEWIRKNRKNLHVGILTHLGAVINLLAGHIKRAPAWLQQGGLEWIWRIFQEPALWRRYTEDGIVFLWLVMTRFLPLKWRLFCDREHEKSEEKPRTEIIETNEEMTVRLSGVCNRYGQPAIREAFFCAAKTGKKVRVDLGAVTYIESSFLGSLFRLWAMLRNQELPLFVCGVNPKIRKLFKLYMVDDFFKENP